MTETATLYTTNDAAQATGLPPHLIQRWQLHRAITAHQPAEGSGHPAGWSHRDILTLEAIAHIRQDLATLGLPCPHTLVHKLWDDLTRWGEADLGNRTVTISIRLGLED